MHRGKIVAAIIIIWLNSFFCYSQNQPRFEIGIGLATFIYQGDLAPSRFGSWETARPGINLFWSKLLSSSFSLRTNLAIGGLKGDDGIYNQPDWRKERGFRFRTPVLELSELFSWSPLGKNFSDKGFSPYLFGGLGLTYLNIKRDWSRYNAEYFDPLSDVSARLALDTAHSLPGLIPVIPVGGGIRYNLSPRFALNAESAYRFAFTDYMDGFSQAANPDLNDHYYTVTVGAIFRIGKKDKFDCPPVPGY